MSKKMDMTIGKPFRLIFLFTIPIIFNYTLQQLYTMADSAIVALALGEDAVTGVNLTGSLTFLVLGFASGSAAGFGVKMAQFVGAKDESQMRKSLFTSLCLTVAISLVLTLFTVLFSEKLLLLLKTNERYIAYSNAYIKAIFSGIICSMGYNLASQFLFAMGDSKSPLLILAISAVLNVGLNSLLFAFDWGVAWAAYATIISQGLAAAVGFIVLFKKFPFLRLKKEDIKFSWGFAWKHLSLALPMAFQFSIIALGSMAQQRAYNQYPPEYAMGQTAAAKVGAIVEGGLYNAIGAACATYFGQNFGAKRLDRLKQGVKHALGVGGILVAAGTAIVFLIFPLVIRLLLPNATQEIYSYAFKYVAINCTGYVFLFGIHLFRNALQGIGKGLTATVGGVLELVSRVGCSFLLSPISFSLACLCNPITWVVSAVFYCIMFIVNLKRLSKNPEFLPLQETDALTQ